MRRSPVASHAPVPYRVNDDISDDVRPLGNQHGVGRGRAFSQRLSPTSVRHQHQSCGRYRRRAVDQATCRQYGSRNADARRLPGRSGPFFRQLFRLQHRRPYGL